MFAKRIEGGILGHAVGSFEHGSTRPNTQQRLVCPVLYPVIHHKVADDSMQSPAAFSSAMRPVVYWSRFASPSRPAAGNAVCKAGPHHDLKHNNRKWKWLDTGLIEALPVSP